MKILSALTITIQEAQESKYQNRHKNSSIFHFMEVAKIKETKMTSQRIHRLEKQVYRKKQSLQQYLDH